MIGRSCGCLCDAGITWRFLGSDAAGGGLSLLLAGGGLVVCWLDWGRGWADCANDSCGTGAAIAGVVGSAGGASFGCKNYQVILDVFIDIKT